VDDLGTILFLVSFDFRFRILKANHSSQTEQVEKGMQMKKLSKADKKKLFITIGVVVVLAIAAVITVGVLKPSTGILGYNANANANANAQAAAVILTKGETWQFQLRGTLNTSFTQAKVYDIDLFKNSAADIANLKSLGHIVVCFFSAGTAENTLEDFANFTGLEGNLVDGMVGERWLNIADIANTNSKLKAAIQWRMNLAVSKGCEAVQVGNVDGYSHLNGLDLTQTQQRNYNEWLATEAHAKGLKVGLTNDGAQVTELVSFFDFAVVEQCYHHGTCNNFLPFTNANKPVFIVEFQEVAIVQNHCADAKSKGFSLIAKNTDLDALPYFQCV
jgi:hypothetical protein